jgi:AraC-like DNA-binding protein
VDLGSEWTRLFVVLEEVGGRIEIRSRSLRGQPTSSDAPHPLSLVPADLEAHGRATGLHFMRHLMLQLDGATLAHMAEDEIDVVDVFTPRLMFFDSGVMHLVQMFAEECASGEPKSLLYGDTLSIALLLALSRLSTSKAPPIKRGQLAPWQIRRVTEYFTAHLADDIQLQSVSDLVKLSRSYFSRAFKMSTGLAPHQWLLEARITKAKQLLLGSNLALAQIAVDIGFADQAHFTRTFGRVAGQSPRAWQRARCG